MFFYYRGLELFGEFIVFLYFWEVFGKEVEPEEADVGYWFGKLLILTVARFSEVPIF